jgi:hypothetical protein
MNIASATRERETRKLVSIERRSVLILSLFLLASLWFRSWPISFGLILGGAVAILNFCWLAMIMEKVFLERKRLHGLQMFIKFFVLAAIIFLIFRYTRVHPIALTVGLSTLVLGILVEVFKEALRFPREDKRS